jgi:hypothetical protein
VEIRQPEVSPHDNCGVVILCFCCYIWLNAACFLAIMQSGSQVEIVRK